MRSFSFDKVRCMSDHARQPIVIESRALNIACESDIAKKKHLNHKATGANNRLQNICAEHSISFINHNGNIKVDNDLN